LIRRYEYEIKVYSPNNYYRGDLIITDYSFIIIALVCLSIADIAIFAYDTRIQKLYQKKKSDKISTVLAKTGKNTSQI
jgi:hypothetical protein